MHNDSYGNSIFYMRAFAAAPLNYCLKSHYIIYEIFFSILLLLLYGNHHNS